MEAPQAEMSIVGRMLRVFYAPSETFEAVSEQRSAADWLVPTVIVAAVVICHHRARSNHTSSEVGQEAMQQQMQDMPAEQREMVEKFQGAAHKGQFARLPRRL